MSLWQRFLDVPGRRKVLAGLGLVSFAAAGLYLSPGLDSDLHPGDRAVVPRAHPPQPPASSS